MTNRAHMHTHTYTHMLATLFSSFYFVVQCVSSPTDRKFSIIKLNYNFLLDSHTQISLYWDMIFFLHPNISTMAQAGKESTCNAGDLGSIPGLGRSPEEGKGYPLQYSGLENSMDCVVHGVTKSWIRLNNLDKHHSYYFGLPRWLSGKESAYQCRRHRFSL